ncbi:hypothetical protein Droror1_Dr00024269 [Drosera rotundifolia]
MMMIIMMKLMRSNKIKLKMKLKMILYRFMLWNQKEWLDCRRRPEDCCRRDPVATNGGRTEAERRQMRRSLPGVLEVVWARRVYAWAGVWSTLSFSEPKRHAATLATDDVWESMVMVAGREEVGRRRSG